MMGFWMNLIYMEGKPAQTEAHVRHKKEALVFGFSGRSHDCRVAWCLPQGWSQGDLT